jgi:hypothetical protein
MGTNAKSATPVLIGLLGTNGLSLDGMAAVIALGRLRMEPDKVLPALYHASLGGAPERDEAVNAIADYRLEGQATLLRLAEHADPGLKARILGALS